MMDRLPSPEGGQGRRTLADALRLAIGASGLSHNELSKRAGVASQGVMRFVKGERGLTLEVADRLCKALGLSLYPDGEEGRPTAPRPMGEVYNHQTVYRAPERPGAISAGLGELRARQWLRSWCRGDPARRYYLNHLWAEVDRSNRPLFKLHLKLMNLEGDRRECLDYFVSCLMELNPVRDQLLPLPQLVEAIEILLDREKSPWRCGPLGARLTPEDVERIIQCGKALDAD